MLANNQVYLSSPLDFNDPFDCRIQENSFDHINEKSLERLAVMHGVPPEEVTNEKTRLLLDELNKRTTQIQGEQKTEFKQLMNSLGVFSLSECNDSILMWSHYANNHKGFCIGFKTDELPAGNTIQKVSYLASANNDIILLHLSAQNLSKNEMLLKLYHDFFLTKYFDWSYEKEWRLIEGKGLQLYQKTAIDSVIFGLNMPIEQKKALKLILNEPKIKFYQAVKSKWAFSLDIVEVD